MENLRIKIRCWPQSLRTNTWRQDECAIFAHWSITLTISITVTCCRPSVLVCSHPPPAPSSCEQWRQRFSFQSPTVFALGYGVGSRGVMTLVKRGHDNRWLNSQDKHAHHDNQHQCATTQRTTVLSTFTPTWRDSTSGLRGEDSVVNPTDFSLLHWTQDIKMLDT